MFVVQGCSHSKGHINPTAGVFGVLEERFRNLRRNTPIPARNNSDCAHRRTGQCNSDCRGSVYGIMSNGKISYRNKGSRL